MEIMTTKAIHFAIFPVLFQEIQRASEINATSATAAATAAALEKNKLNTQKSLTFGCC